MLDASPGLPTLLQPQVLPPHHVQSPPSRRPNALIERQPAFAAVGLYVPYRFYGRKACFAANRVPSAVKERKAQAGSLYDYGHCVQGR